MNYLFKNLSILSSIILSSFTFSQTCNDLNGAYVLAQDSNNTYLGFFGSNIASESINNSIGIYGSTISPTSVRNSISQFGSSISQYSANNNIAFSPPIIYRGMTPIAYLTTNSLKTPGLSLNVIDSVCTFTAFSPVYGPISNSPATWLTPSFAGTFDVGQIIAIGFPVFDNNGTSNINLNGSFGVSIRNSDGSIYDSFTINAEPSVETAVGSLFISPAYAGKEIIVAFSFVDDQGFLETSNPFSFGFVPSQNQAPVISSSPALNATEDVQYSYNIVANDPDGDSLSINYIVPSWLVFNGTSFTGTPTNDDVGLSEVTLTVSDPDGLSDTQIFTLNVINSNDDAIYSGSFSKISCGYIRDNINYAIDEEDKLIPSDEVICAVASQENSNPIIYTFSDDDGISDALNNGNIEFFTYSEEEGYIQIVEENNLSELSTSDSSLTIWSETINITEEMIGKSLFFRFTFDDDFGSTEISQLMPITSVDQIFEEQIPAMGGMGLLALGLSMLGLGAVRSRRRH